MEKCSGQNQRNPCPLPQEPEDRRNSGCRIPFQKPAFVFLASVVTSLITAAGPRSQLEPLWAPGGREEEGLAPCTCPYCREAAANGGGWSLSCAMFSPECRVGSRFVTLSFPPSLHPRLMQQMPRTVASVCQVEFRFWIKDGVARITPPPVPVNRTPLRKQVMGCPWLWAEVGDRCPGFGALSRHHVHPCLICL